MIPKRKNTAPDNDQAGETPESNLIQEAHTQADRDIESDPDLNTEPRAEDEMDEGELARLEGED